MILQAFRIWLVSLLIWQCTFLLSIINFKSASDNSWQKSLTHFWFGVTFFMFIDAIFSLHYLQGAVLQNFKVFQLIQELEIVRMRIPFLQTILDTRILMLLCSKIGTYSLICISWKISSDSCLNRFPANSTIFQSWRTIHTV